MSSTWSFRLSFSKVSLPLVPFSPVFYTWGSSFTQWKDSYFPSETFPLFEVSRLYSQDVVPRRSWDWTSCFFLPTFRLDPVPYDQPDLLPTKPYPSLPGRRGFSPTLSGPVDVGYLLEGGLLTLESKFADDFNPWEVWERPTAVNVTHFVTFLTQEHKGTRTFMYMYIIFTVTTFISSGVSLHSPVKGWVNVSPMTDTLHSSTEVYWTYAVTLCRRVRAHRLKPVKGSWRVSEPKE